MLFNGKIITHFEKFYLPMNWCFAIINNKLAEVYFEKKKGEIKFLGHCYIDRSDYRSKREKEWIEKDTIRVQLIYRNRAYKSKPDLRS